LIGQKRKRKKRSIATRKEKKRKRWEKWDGDKDDRWFFRKRGWEVAGVEGSIYSTYRPEETAKLYPRALKQDETRPVGVLARCEQPPLGKPQTVPVKLAR